MKAPTLSALVVLLLYVAVSAQPRTAAAEIYNMFCSLSTEEQNTLLACLATKLPQVSKAIEDLGYSISELSKQVCVEGANTFPENLLFLVGGALPHLYECFPQESEEAPQPQSEQVV
uniref:Putative secreted protein n=1 Tax=Amblyomma triste TaxID=251400 RepID=A0A023G0L4_AMBTT